jgi:hypothetical protein
MPIPVGIRHAKKWLTLLQFNKELNCEFKKFIALISSGNVDDVHHQCKRAVRS